MKPTIERLDWFLLVPAAAALLMITEIDAPREVSVQLDWLAKGAILAGLTVVASVLVAVASAIDRRCTEEYLFQVLANAALVSMAATMLVNLAWVIAKKALGLPELDSDNIVGILTLGWVISYYWFRLKGIAR